MGKWLSMIMNRGMIVVGVLLVVAGCSDTTTSPEQGLVDEMEAGVEQMDEAIYEYPSRKVPEDIAAAFEMEHPVVAYLEYLDEENYYVDATETLWHYYQSQTPHEKIHFEAVPLNMVIPKNQVRLLDKVGNEINEDELLPDDHFYLDYDLSQYDYTNNNVSLDQVIVHAVTAKEIVEDYYTENEGEYHVTMMYIEGSGHVIDPSWDELDIILRHPTASGFHGIAQEPGAPPRRDLKSALGLETLPQIIVFGHQGPVYVTDSVEGLLHYLEELE
ncbi:hypothetical protein [Alkalihalophilus marmarensis]|uniref:Uncharacterized protein n=1 Tax=Alkalihalophilus marmarensis DSM 21297 TaxID=1188261 RepID=U6SJB3_9BACI|nr:hypothetical protein [Alkalihalophilus marmarensis]ERN51809.1 hypothetical protein A33I_18530 [Alkalihalophilus marmarensis DSM 21297]